MSDKPEVDKRRKVSATPFDWKAEGYPDYGNPGLAGKYTDDILQFACPGCGRFGAVTVGHPKPTKSPSWDIVSGSLEDVTTLTLHPSLNCVGCCKWHGWLRAGVFEPC